MLGKNAFKDFMITELNPRKMARSSGEFLVCQPTKDEYGNLCLSLNLPESIKREMLEAVKQGQFVRLFAPTR